jgi:dTMP kinase
MNGLLIAFEGIDQSGKETLASLLYSHLRKLNIKTQMISFPDYDTPIGREIKLYLKGKRDYPPEARQLLFVANRWEREKHIRKWLAEGVVVIVDRYISSGIAYGVAHGLDQEWVTCLERELPQPNVTFLVDIPFEVSFNRKGAGRDLYELRCELLEKAREIYRGLASDQGWIMLDGTKAPETLSEEVLVIIEKLMGKLC